jgi:predicted RNA binding protein YcfA (HicA-like mRNA interferase family)
MLARVDGSHHIFTIPGRRERIVIPIERESAAEERIAAVSDEDCRASRG